jgi:hypothetical protein
MAALTVTDVTVSGVLQTLAAAAAGGDDFFNGDDQRTFFVVTNGGGAPINVTIDAIPTSVNVTGWGSVPVSDTVVAVANSTTRVIGPFPPQRFNNAAGRVAVTYSGVSSVTVAAFRLPVVA